MRGGPGRPAALAVAILASLTLLGLATGPTAGASGHVPDECLEDADLDGGLVIDRSGSMSGERLQAAKDGAKLFLDDLNDTDQSGLVSYSSSATLDKSLGPNHTATREAVEDLSAGGGTDTGTGIDLSHDDFNNNGRDDAKHVMILLSDGHSGGDPVTEADQAKADGIVIYAIGVGDNIDEPELREIASDPDDRYFYHAEDSTEVEDVFQNITDDVRRNDTEEPNVSIGRPEPGHQYIGGEDQGPNTARFDDRADIVGNMSFTAQASDDCLIEEVRFETSPDAGWNDTDNETDITTSTFPANTVPAGNYTLFTNATDWVGKTDRNETPFRVVDHPPPYWVDAETICGGTQRVLADETLRFDLTAKSDNASRVVSLDVFGLPEGASFPIPDPENPVSSTFSWTPNETQVGLHNVTFRAEDDLGLRAPDCPVTIEVRDDPIYWENPTCGTTIPVVAGETLSFEAVAASLHEDRDVAINVSGLPEGASFPIPDPANPVNSTFTWTPDDDQFGDHNVTFHAEDAETGDPGPDCPVTLNVLVPPHWDNPSPVCGADRVVIVGETVEFEVQAASIDADRNVSLTDLGPPDGASFPIPDPDNPVNSTFTWTPDSTQTGQHEVGFHAEDDLGVAAPECSITLEVFDSEVVWLEPSCGTTKQVLVDEAFSMEVAAKSPYEDRLVSLDASGLPTGASFPIPDPDNPVNSTFSWTPTEAQIGQHNVTFHAEDDAGNQAPDCQVTLDVRIPPEWDHDAPICDTRRRVPVGDTVTLEPTAISLDGNRTVSLDASDLPTGASFPIPDPANPVNSTFTWTPDSTQTGQHEVGFHAEDDLGLTAPDCPATILVFDPRGQALAQGLWTGNAVPTSTEVQTDGVDQRGPGSTVRRHVIVERGDHRIESLEEKGEVRTSEDQIAASGATKAANVSLFGGLVEIDGLEQRANLTWTPSEQNHTLATDTRVANLTIGNETIPIHRTDEPLTLPVPGGGTLVLFERTKEVTDNGILYRENLIHAYMGAAYGRAEVILGSLELRAGESPPALPYKHQDRRIHEQDDAGSGEDAANTTGNATKIDPGLHHGSLPVGDNADVYGIELDHGEKITVDLRPANRLEAEAPAAEGGSGSARAIGPGFYEVELIDPEGQRREVASTTAFRSTVDVVNERLEFNADIDGTWFLEVERSIEDKTANNYSLAASVTPLPLLPDAQAAPWGDHPDACDPAEASIPDIDTGVWPGVFKHEDRVDVYRFEAEIGETITAALKPGETLDGMSARLVLYDENCDVLEETGGPVLNYKGFPRAVTEHPSEYTGEYFIAVERLNGVGNYYLNLDVVSPQPTLPQNDASTGTDAASSCAAATPAPPALYQGRLHDGDPGDAYLVPFQENFTAYVAVEMSEFSEIDVRLTAPSGERISPTVERGDARWLFVFGTDEAGDYCLEVDPEHGGGNYLVSHGEVASFEPLEPARGPRADVPGSLLDPGDRTVGPLADVPAQHFGSQGRSSR